MIAPVVESQIMITGVSWQHEIMRPPSCVNTAKEGEKSACFNTKVRLKTAVNAGGGGAMGGDSTVF